MTPEELFKRWFTDPIESLRKLDRGDGAFVALMTALPLYERAIVAAIKLRGDVPSDPVIRAEMDADLGIAPAVGAKFHAIFRNGFMHQAMGLDGPTKWRISADYTHSPAIVTEAGVDYVCIDPWKFAEFVVGKFQANPALIVASDSFPFAAITP